MFTYIDRSSCTTQLAVVQKAFYLERVLSTVERGFGIAANQSL